MVTATDTMTRPFLCGKCGNWYTPVPVPEGESCRSCDWELHARDTVTDVFDCHFGHQSATLSEVDIMHLQNRVGEVSTNAQAVLDAIEKGSTLRIVTETLKTAETEFAKAELGITNDIPEIIRWAGIKELPGMAGEAPTHRFKSMEAIELLVADKRRPHSDLEELQRSVKVCNAVASEIPGAMSDARMLLSLARRAAETYAPPETKRTRGKNKK
jgi:hypothetical protein